MNSTVVITYFTGHKNAAKGVKGGRVAFIKGVKCGKILTTILSGLITTDLVPEKKIILN